MTRKIDYTGRGAFLKATTSEIAPAPIDDLLKLLPVFRAWRARAKHEHPSGHGHAPTSERISAILAGATYTISVLDDSPEVAALKDAVSALAERYRFLDSWINDAAIATLFVHAAGSVEHAKWYDPRGWYFPKTWNDPIINIEPRRGNETDVEYLGRVDQEYQAQKREIADVQRFRTGALANHQPAAKWTARVFALEIDDPYAEIARTEKYHGTGTRRFNRKYIRTIVANFADRIGLTLPTLADSLAARTGKAGKDKVMQG